MQSQKLWNDLGSFPGQIIQHHSDPSLCTNHWCRRSWSWLVLWDLQHLLELTSKQCFFHHRRLKCKSRKSRDSQNNRQVWPCGTKWSTAKVNRILSREHAGHSKCPFPTTQKITLHMYISRWSTLKSDYCVACSLDRETLHSQQRNTGADCGSDHTLLMAKLRKISGKNHPATQVWPKSNPLWLCSGSDE